MFMSIPKSKGKRHVKFVVNYLDSKKKLKPRTYEFGETLAPEKLNEVQVCLGTGPWGLTNAVIYANNKIKIFENKKDLYFDWKKQMGKNYLLDEHDKYEGKFKLLMFNVIEGAGGPIYKAEKTEFVKTKCFTNCSLPTTNNILSWMCQVCNKKKHNNVNRIDLKKCKRSCNFLSHLRPFGIQEH